MTTDNTQKNPTGEIELSDKQLDAVSGGQEVIVPPTHEDIDAAWDMIELIAQYDENAALCAAYDNKLIPYMHVRNALSYWTQSSMRNERARMHRALDAGEI